MTTVVRTRQPLQVLSMSNQPGPRKSKRLAGLYDEQDGDFQFKRASKRPKREAPVEEEKPAPMKKSGKGRLAKDRTASATTASTTTTTSEAVAAIAATADATSRRSSRRKVSVDAIDDMSRLVVPKRTTRRSTRRTSAEEQLETNGAAADEGDPMDLVGRTPEPAPRDESEKVTLPLSDTPVINRNKEMRKKGGGNRRSSLGMRGRRASSLIEMGHTALPHKEVDSVEFYKHIEAVGLPEPRRMKQLLTWCGERALSEKPPIGASNSHAIHGARAIQDQLLKDFQSKSEFSDWFSREDGPAIEVVKKPNPRNIELEEKARQVEENIKRLCEQKKAWLALKKTAPAQEPLFSEDDASSIPLPDEVHLDPVEAQMFKSLSASTTSFSALRLQAEARLKAVQSSLEFRVDTLADGVHKLEQRVATAGREADKVLGLGASRLKEREEREQAAAGTSEIPVMEVIRSLARILPKNGDD